MNKLKMEKIKNKKIIQLNKIVIMIVLIQIVVQIQK